MKHLPSRSIIWRSILIKIVFIFIALPVQSQNLKKDNTYDARVGELEILTPPPPEAPRINGPTIYGARKNKHFIYRIPCEGIRPVAFTAEGLPESLSLDASSGIIQGTTPSADDTFNIIFRAKNSRGSDERKFTLIIGEKIALTPPVGWNSWGGYMLMVSDEVMRKATDILVNEGLADVGFQYVSIDDCWMRIDPDFFEQNRQMYDRRAPGYPFEKAVGPVRDEYGRIQTNDFFPDMKAMTDYIHSFGLKAGIYSGPGPLTCQNFVSSFGYEAQDAIQFAEWGFDLLKYDMCSYRAIMKNLNEALPEESPEISEITIWHPMSEFLLLQDRDILYNLCQYGRQDPWKWAPEINIQSWRIGGDLNHHVENYFEQALRIVKDLREYSKPGQWNDPDFMYIGKIRNARDKTAPSVDIPLNTNQRYQYVSLWSLITAPFFFSADMGELDDFTINLLRNADIVNVNQDALGHVAEVFREDVEHIILLKKLEDGGLAAGVFNLNNEKEIQINLSWEELGIEKKANVRDLWRQRDLGEVKNGLKVTLSPNGCAVFKIN
jgi:alpha-galactosidase